MTNRKCVSGVLAVTLIFGVAAAASAAEPKPPQLNPKVVELLSKYAGSDYATWGKENVRIYYIDPLRFDEFKAELDALGEYVQKGNWNEDDYEKGKSRATWAVFPNDFECELQLQKGNSPPSTYWYEKSSAPKR